MARRRGMTLQTLQKELRKNADPEKAKLLRGFFKTGPAEYGEGDVFLGIVVPVQRKIAKDYLHLTLQDLKKLLAHKIHEYRFTALVILAEQYRRGAPKQKEKIAQFFLRNRTHINNWDLVDTATPHILGDYLLDRDKTILYSLARSKNLWDRRIAILATFRFIKENRFEETFALAQLLLSDTHDLIHKAIGWALREVGKKSLKAEEEFLQKYYQTMPRTALRYAIERFSQDRQRFYMKKPR